jgi:hypothetical protein
MRNCTPIVCTVGKENTGLDNDFGIPSSNCPSILAMVVHEQALKCLKDTTAHNQHCTSVLTVRVLRLAISEDNVVCCDLGSIADV